MESIKSERSTEEFNQETARGKEKGLLEKFSDGAPGKWARTLMLLSTLSAVAYTERDAHAGNDSPGESYETQEDHTASSAWSRRMAETMKDEVTQLSDLKDADWFMKDRVNTFISEFYAPTEGNIHDGAYGIPMRVYNDADYNLLKQNTEIVHALVKSVSEKFPDLEMTAYKEQLENMSFFLKQQTSYAGKAQRRVLERAEALINNYSR